MKARPVIDVSQLPAEAFDTRSPPWWGNTLMLCIETMTVVMTLASYFYLWRNQAPWPPPLVETLPTVERPVPHLGAATANTLLLLASCVPMAWAARAARRGDAPAVRTALLALLAVGVASVILTVFEFRALRFRWNDNAYGSVVWAAMFFQLIYVTIGAAEVGLLAVWVSAVRCLDEKHAVDVTIAAIYWFWMVGVGAVFYAVIFWWPRLL